MKPNIYKIEQLRRVSKDSLFKSRTNRVYSIVKLAEAAAAASAGSAPSQAQNGKVSIPGSERFYTYNYDSAKDVFIVVTDNKNNGKYVGQEYPINTYAYQMLATQGKPDNEVATAKQKLDQAKQTGRTQSGETFTDQIRAYQTQGQNSGQNQAAAAGGTPSAIQNGLVQVSNRGIDVSNITTDLSRFIDELGAVARRLGAETPVITSGYRNHDSQARIMIGNWKSNGGYNGGRKYMMWLYGNRRGAPIDDMMKKYKIGTQEEQFQQCQQELVAFLKANFQGEHTRSPATAVDVRSSTSKIYEVLTTIKSEGKVRINIGDERSTANPHFHISIG